MRLLSERFYSEFHGQINSTSNRETARVSLTISGKTSSVSIERNRVVSCDLLHNLNGSVMYLDDPITLSCLPFMSDDTDFALHQVEMSDAIRFAGYAGDDVVGSIIDDEKLSEIFTHLNEVTDGSLTPDGPMGMFYHEERKEPLDIRNLSAGLRPFAIIKALLLNRKIGRYSTLVLDEPEIHLHPEWQLQFAQIIVLLQKYYDMHILINTHSPYFVHAIEVYAAFYEVADRCHYYLTNRDSEGCFANDVTNNIDEAYVTMAVPFIMLDELQHGKASHE